MTMSNAKFLLQTQNENGFSSVYENEVLACADLLPNRSSGFSF